MITYWHNPRCSKSRAGLALLEAHGAEVQTRAYLNAPPTIAELKEVLAALNISAQQRIEMIDLLSYAVGSKGLIAGQMADLAKFAKYTPVANENEQCFEIAKLFVSGTMVMPLDEPKKEGAAEA